ncbi:hypothetical protein AAFX91_04355 [Bradyrhizobium sp. 31Argb]|uniref:hypothetical protein n=1 Tax=Bradyrhizobium sp. 31Argb TaxID=3141247 RepID=UPI003749CC4D
MGALYLKVGRYEDAAEHFRNGIEHGDASGYVGLGRATYMLAEFTKCAEAFEKAAAFGPLDADDFRQYARARSYAAFSSAKPSKA